MYSTHVLSPLVALILIVTDLSYELCLCMITLLISSGLLMEAIIHLVFEMLCHYLILDFYVR